MSSPITLISRSPAENAENVPPGSSIVLTFSGPVKAGTGWIQVRDYYYGVIFAGPMNSSFATISGNTVTIDPVEDFGYGYSIEVEFRENWLVDEQGAAISVPRAFNFEIAKSPTALYLRGTESYDVLHGSELGDFIDGAGGSDTIFGHGGDDILVAGYSQSLSGARLAGGAGNDTLHGGVHDDFLYGGDGDDQVRGGDGDDHLYGDTGNDVLEGGAGNDRLSDAHGSNTFVGGAGNDIISAEGGGNYIDGGEGNDQIYALAGNTVVAGDGNDLVRLTRTWSFEPGDGSVDGGAGDDVFEFDLVRSSSFLTLTGGSGKDTFRVNLSHYGSGTYQYEITDFEAGAGGDRLNLSNVVEKYSYYYGNGNPFASSGFLRLQADGNDTLLILKPEGNATLLRFKNVAPSQFTRDNFVGGYPPDGSNLGITLVATGGGDELHGTELGDKLIGGDGNDRLVAFGGNDLLRAGAGDDHLEGGDGNDRLEGNDGDDELRGGHGDDTLLGGSGNDLLTVSGSSFLMDGGVGDDELIVLGDGTGSVFGGAGDDVVRIATAGMYSTYSGTVRVDGGEGNDTISIYGDRGYITLVASGGAGRDTFDFSSYGGNKITITDFMVGNGGDRIALDALTPDGLEGDPFSSTGFLRWRQVGQDAILEIDADGIAGTRSGWRDLATISNTNAADFTRDNFKTRFGSNEDDVLIADRTENTLEGLGGNDTLVGGTGKDILRGGSGNDKLDGGDGNDVLKGGDGDDQLGGGNGNDEIVGGAGFDVVRIASTRDDLNIWDFYGSFYVRDLSGKGGTDLLTGVERLQLDDTNVALDIDDVGGQIFRLYHAAFDRDPDAVGAGFWLNAADSGVSLLKIAEGFVASDEFKTLYGAAPSNAELVDRLLLNVGQLRPDAVERAHWIDVLDHQAAPLASVLVGISESERAVRYAADIFDAGFEYKPWMG